MQKDHKGTEKAEMKLYEKIPDHVEVNGKRIRVDLDFRNVLKMIDIIGRDDLLPDAREWLAMKCICRRPVKGMMPEIMKMLFPKAEARERITDFEQDADLIRAAFMQAYGINLFRDKLNWFEFSCLLSCIPEGSKYSDILSIRARPMPEANQYNQKERQWLAEAKAQFGLKITEKEQEERYKKDVHRISSFLMALEGKTDG